MEHFIPLLPIETNSFASGQNYQLILPDGELIFVNETVVFIISLETSLMGDSFLLHTKVLSSHENVSSILQWSGMYSIL